MTLIEELREELTKITIRLGKISDITGGTNNVNTFAVPTSNARARELFIERQDLTTRKRRLERKIIDLETQENQNIIEDGETQSVQPQTSGSNSLTIPLLIGAALLLV